MDKETGLSRIIGVLAFLVAALVVRSLGSSGPSDLRYSLEDVMQYGIDSAYAAIVLDEANNALDTLFELPRYREYIGETEGEEALLRGQQATLRSYSVLNGRALDSLANLQLEMMVRLSPGECAAVGTGNVTAKEQFALMQRLPQDKFRTFVSMNMRANIIYFSGSPPVSPTDNQVLSAWENFATTLTEREIRRFEEYLNEQESIPEEACWLQRQIFESMLSMSEPYKSNLLKSIIAEVEASDAPISFSQRR